MKRTSLFLAGLLAYAGLFAQQGQTPYTTSINARTIDKNGGLAVPAGYFILQNNGVSIASRSILNFVNGGCVDNAGTLASDCTLAGGGGAPTGATYITQTPDGTLSAEQALSALATGLVKNTTATGVLSIYGGATCTNQFVRSLDASAAATCASVGTNDITAANVTLAKIANASANSRLLGSGSAGSGASYAELTSSTLTFGASSVDAALTTTNDGGAIVKQPTSPGTQQGSGGNANVNINGKIIEELNSLGTTATDGTLLQNTTAATGGATSQFSPALKLAGTAWNSVGSASETDYWRIFTRPNTAAGATNADLRFDVSIAGGATTNPLKLASNGDSTFSGNMTINGSANPAVSIPNGLIQAQGFNISASSGSLVWASKGSISQGTDGLYTFTNNGGTAAGRLRLGGTTASFPGIKIESASAISSRLADDSAYGGVVADNVVVQTANGAQWLRGSISEQLTLSTGATTTDTAANLLPANSLIEAVVFRITTSITTATTIQLGDATTSGRFSGALSATPCGAANIAANATGICLNVADPTATAAAGPQQTTAAKLRVTTNVNPGAGIIRITVFYRQFVAPTS